QRRIHRQPEPGAAQVALPVGADEVLRPGQPRVVLRPAGRRGEIDAAEEVVALAAELQQPLPYADQQSHFAAFALRLTDELRARLEAAPGERREVAVEPRP